MAISKEGDKCCFAYTGDVQAFTVPYDGTYQLQVRGASGGRGGNNGACSTVDGGYGGCGGYSYGEITFGGNQTLYVSVGGQGKNAGSAVGGCGGWNGGGNGACGSGSRTGGGGGATHIATASGLLCSLSGNQSSVIIVAGGGGSTAWNCCGNGGYGGGSSGGAGWGCGCAGGTGGTQTAGGTGGNSGVFGKGGNSITGSHNPGGAGGGGWYGGGSGVTAGSGTVSQGGGGSGYVKTSLVSCGTCAGNVSFPFPYGGTETGHCGDGFAIITYLKSKKVPTNIYCCNVPIEGIYMREGDTISACGCCKYSYTGAEQIFTAPATGKYKIQLRGASGGGYGNANCAGKGGYSEGVINLNSGDLVHVYVGGCGLATNSATTGGFNGGGGVCSSGCGASGGGATDIRVGGSTLFYRRMVAGGGGGGSCCYCKGGSGGGLTGCQGVQWKDYAAGCGGTQTSAGSYVGTIPTGGCCGNYNLGVGFGCGGRGMGSSSGGGGGGGGWYGGSGGGISGGGGGSGYVYNSSTCGNAPSGYNHNSCYYIEGGFTKSGDEQIPSITGGTETGHSGDGYAIISYDIKADGYKKICAAFCCDTTIFPVVPPPYPGGIYYNWYKGLISCSATGKEGTWRTMCTIPYCGYSTLSAPMFQYGNSYPFSAAYGLYCCCCGTMLTESITVPEGYCCDIPLTCTAIKNSTLPDCRTPNSNFDYANIGVSPLSSGVFHSICPYLSDGYFYGTSTSQTILCLAKPCCAYPLYHYVPTEIPDDTWQRINCESAGHIYNTEIVELTNLCRSNRYDGCCYRYICYKVIDETKPACLKIRDTFTSICHNGEQPFSTRCDYAYGCICIKKCDTSRVHQCLCAKVSTFVCPSAGTLCAKSISSMCSDGVNNLCLCRECRYGTCHCVASPTSISTCCICSCANICGCWKANCGCDKTTNISRYTTYYANGTGSGGTSDVIGKCGGVEYDVSIQPGDNICYVYLCSFVLSCIRPVDNCMSIGSGVFAICPSPENPSCSYLSYAGPTCIYTQCPLLSGCCPAYAFTNSSCTSPYCSFHSCCIGPGKCVYVEMKSTNPWLPRCFCVYSRYDTSQINQWPICCLEWRSSYDGKTWYTIYCSGDIHDCWGSSTTSKCMKFTISPTCGYFPYHRLYTWSTNDYVAYRYVGISQINYSNFAPNVFGCQGGGSEVKVE